MQLVKNEPDEVTLGKLQLVKNEPDEVTMSTLVLEKLQLVKNEPDLNYYYVYPWTHFLL